MILPPRPPRQLRPGELVASSNVNLVTKILISRISNQSKKMADNMLEWRRRWTPDLSALPWIPFTIENTNILVKSQFTHNSYTILVYDYTSMWEECCRSAEVKARSKKCNPNVEAPLDKLLQHLNDHLQEKRKGSTYSLKYQDGEEEGMTMMRIKLVSKLEGVPFNWKLTLKQASDEMMSLHLTVPLLTMVSELTRREKELQRLLQKKDEEIEDYKMSGAKVSRKHKQTSVFDGKAFHQEMVHSKGFKGEVESNGQSAFAESGQDLYKEVMVTRAWLDRPVERDDGSEDDELAGGADPTLADGAGPTVPSWAGRIPASVVADVPSVADTLSSPAKSSPSKSPLKASPAAAQETELMRREALEKRLAEEKAKLQSKKKKKKLF